MSEFAGRRRKGSSHEKILDAIEEILVEEGMEGLSMRNLAARAQVSLGTVSHFGTKESLIQRFVDRLIDDYALQFDEIERQAGTNAQRHFFSVVQFLLRDVRSKRTSKVIPELWAMGNRNASIQRALDALYQRERDALEELFSKGWPEIDASGRRLIIGTLIPIIEGFVLFAPDNRTRLYADFNHAEALRHWVEGAIATLPSRVS